MHLQPAETFWSSCPFCQWIVSEKQTVLLVLSSETTPPEWNLEQNRRVWMCKLARNQYPVALLFSRYKMHASLFFTLNALCRHNSAYTAICCINLSELIWYLDQWQVMRWPMAVECFCSSRLNLGMPKLWTARDHAILQAAKQTNAHSLLYFAFCFSLSI